MHVYLASMHTHTHCRLHSYVHVYKRQNETLQAPASDSYDHEYTLCLYTHATDGRHHVMLIHFETYMCKHA